MYNSLPRETISKILFVLERRYVNLVDGSWNQWNNNVYSYGIRIFELCRYSDVNTVVEIKRFKVRVTLRNVGLSSNSIALEVTIVKMTLKKKKKLKNDFL